MKILLLTDIPPCSNLTAGIALAQMCRFLPRDSIVCFTVLNRHLKPLPYPDLKWIPTEIVLKPNEFGLHEGDQRSPSKLVRAMLKENFRRWFRNPRIVNRAVAFGRTHQAEAVWAVLQGQTMVRLALPVARRLDVPLYSQVWDPLSWWLRAHRVDPWNSHLARRDFRHTLRASRSCATASWAMAEEYERRFGVRSIPVIASQDPSISAPVAQKLRTKDKVVIGMAGQFYASDEWHVLIHALDIANWRVCNRSVEIKVIGFPPPPNTLADKVKYLGWQSQADAIKILSTETDILFCPYPFAEPMQEVARLSFPSKLPLYFAAGRPILFHGPAWSSPGQYLAKHSAAALATLLEPALVYNELQRLVTSPKLYRKIALAGRVAFLSDFTLEIMRASFYKFLELPAPRIRKPKNKFVRRTRAKG